MIQERVKGNIMDFYEDGMVLIMAPLPNLDRAVYRKYSEVEVVLPDGRSITAEQRRKAFALLGEIAEFVDGVRNSQTVEDAKEMMKWDFIAHCMESQERKIFSLSDCDETTAREFISYVIDFIIKHGIPTHVPLIEQAEDIGRYVYSCAANRRCAICGRAADIHHCTGDRIGMGGDREIVHHLGRKVLPLCREHHDLAHHGEIELMTKYHLAPIKLDERLCKILKLKK